MTSVEEQLHEQGAAPESPATTGTGRRELKDWQAQLLALAVTVGITAAFVVLFSLVTGSL